ncbi:hypothetical protein L6452_43586 [Arctium lappa]|uniref:Uncharacterized protein n=1 Tax=Arctium lappa TaxID=4217 RepID=A0ACB8XDK6_ARCLA|nr:hypothetical protein L6452_43586 [Arctium lappa]
MYSFESFLFLNSDHMLPELSKFTEFGDRSVLFIHKASAAALRVIFCEMQSSIHVKFAEVVVNIDADFEAVEAVCLLSNNNSFIKLL